MAGAATKLTFAAATAADAPVVAQVHTAATRHLLELHARDASKCQVTEKGVLYGMKTQTILVARSDGEIIALLSLSPKRPWAIHPEYFTPVKRALYLTNMAVAPEWQRQNIGRRLLDHARVVAQSWPGDAIRLDAYDNETGAGRFYAKCGYREVGRVSYRKTPLIYYELVL